MCNKLIGGLYDCTLARIMRNSGYEISKIKSYTNMMR